MSVILERVGSFEGLLDRDVPEFEGDIVVRYSGS